MVVFCCWLLLQLTKTFGNDNNKVSWQDIDNIQRQLYPKKLSKIDDQMTRASDEDFNSIII